ncbi:MAG: hypothetical protein JNJ59_28035 [Deltaproteobacteria bacterium]|nr:hypothetical protein [Deltaproteobacteria bacterium]
MGKRYWAAAFCSMALGACGLETKPEDTILPAEGSRRCFGFESQVFQDGEWVMVYRCVDGCTGAGVCQGPPRPSGQYFAVILDDSRVFASHRSDGGDPCATASAPLYAHGADIDAVGLFRGASLVGYLDVVDYLEGGVCAGAVANTMTDVNQARGAPDGAIDRGFVSLGGGFLTGEFDNSALIQTGYTIVVYEIGKKCGTNTSCGGVDEGYEVFVAEELDCVNRGGYPFSACAIELSDSVAGEATVPVSGF